MLINLSHNTFHHFLQFLKISILLNLSRLFTCFIFTLHSSSKIIYPINHFTHLHLFLTFTRNLKFVYIFMFSFCIGFLNLLFFKLIIFFVLINTLKFSNLRGKKFAVNAYHLIILIINLKYVSL